LTYFLPYSSIEILQILSYIDFAMIILYAHECRKGIFLRL